MSVYGYSRKNYPIALIQQLKNIQVFQCDEIYVEEEELRDDREFQRLLKEEVAPGDTLVLHSLLVFGKSLKQLVPFIEVLEAKNVRLICVEDGIDTQEGNLSFYHLIARLGEMDRYYQANVTQKGRAAMVEKGLLQGRPGISSEKVDEINYLRREKGYSVRKIAETCRVSVGTVHKYLKVWDGSESSVKY